MDGRARCLASTGGGDVLAARAPGRPWRRPAANHRRPYFQSWAVMPPGGGWAASARFGGLRMGDGRDEASTTGSSVEGRFGSSSLGAARAATLGFREKAGGAGFAPAPLVAGGASRLACGEERATAGEAGAPSPPFFGDSFLVAFLGFSSSSASRGRTLRATGWWLKMPRV